MINCINFFGNNLWSISSIIFKICECLSVQNIEREDFNFKPLRSDENDTEKIADLLEKNFNAYLNLILGYLQSILDKISEKNRNSITPQTNLKENLLHIKDEVKVQLQNSVNIIEKSNSEQLYTKLQIEIERCVVLQNKIDGLTKLLHKISFIIYEEIDRLAWVHGTAIELSTLDDFRIQVQLCKSRLVELLERHNMSNLHISEEYENQRQLWEQKILQVNQLVNQELNYLSEQLHYEKSSSEKLHAKMNIERERMKEDFTQSEKIYKEEIEKHIKKSFDLESNLLENRHRLFEIEQTNINLERAINEKEDTMLSYGNHSLNDLIDFQ